MREQTPRSEAGEEITPGGYDTSPEEVSSVASRG